jgi:hypothetical protein
MQHDSPSLSRPASRRAALAGGAGILAALGLVARQPGAAAQATPVAAPPTSGLLLVQAFSDGSLFPTQGSDGVLPYTLILWDAADRGFFTVSAAARVAGFAPTDALIAAITAGERPLAAVVLPAATDGSTGERAWPLRLAYAGLGSDPGAVTYQGEAVSPDDASAWLGAAPQALPEGPLDLKDGFLVIAGLPSLDLPDTAHLRIPLG